MTSSDPVWHTGVKATHNGERAIGRIFIQGEDVYYFAELPDEKGASLLTPLAMGGFGVLFFICGLLPSNADPSITLSTYGGMLDMLLVFSPVLGLLLIVLAVAYFYRQTLVAKRAVRELLKADEHLGMSLDQRFSISPSASRFKLADIVHAKGRQTVVVETNLGEKYRFTPIPHDPTLASRLIRQKH